MTQRKHLKRRIRERMAKTGESYTSARAQLQPTAQPRIPVEEQVDVRAQAVSAGLACAVYLTPELHAALGAAQLAEVLDRLRALAEACRDAPGGRAFYEAALLGQPLPPLGPVEAELAELRRFLARVRAGVRGVSPTGRCAALEVGGRTVVALVPSAPGRRPALWLCAQEGLGAKLLGGLAPDWAVALDGLGWVGRLR